MPLQTAISSCRLNGGRESEGNYILDYRAAVKYIIPTVKLHYYPETDSLYIDLNSKPGADSREIAEGLVVDFDAQGNVVGIDIDHASEKLDLKTLEAVSLPLSTTKIG